MEVFVIYATSDKTIEKWRANVFPIKAFGLKSAALSEIEALKKNALNSGYEVMEVVFKAKKLPKSLYLVSERAIDSIKPVFAFDSLHAAKEEAGKYSIGNSPFAQIDDISVYH